MDSSNQCVSSQNSKKDDRSINLDLIRFGAVLSVFLYHVAVRYDLDKLGIVGRFFHKYGFLGVDVFFPLSGYLICAGIINRPHPFVWKNFLLRRFFRIVPLYMVAVTLYLIATSVLSPVEETYKRIWICYSFLTGWAIFFLGTSAVPYRVTWSLSVEEIAYLLVCLFASFGKRSLFVGLVAITATSLLTRTLLTISNFENLYYFPPARLDSIAIGGILAFVPQDRWKLAISAFSGIILCVFLLSLSSIVAFKVLLYTIVCLITCLIIYVAQLFPSSRKPRGFYALSRIGVMAYFLYLMQYFFIDGAFLVIRWAWAGSAPPSFWIFVVLLFCIMTIAAYVSNAYFEQPLIRFGKSFEFSVESKGSQAKNKGTEVRQILHGKQ